MNEKQFYEILSKDPTPGIKDRIKRFSTKRLSFPGWVFNSNEDTVIIGGHASIQYFKNIDKGIVYSILQLGLTDFKNYPKCPCCGEILMFNTWARPFPATCGREKCISKNNSKKVGELWNNTEYREQQSKSHKEWSAIEENKSLMRQRSIDMWKRSGYREHQSEVHKSFAINNPEKISSGIHSNEKCNKSDTGVIRCDSSWEKLFVQFCNSTNEIIKVERANFSIPYTDSKGSRRNYFPDFLITIDNKVLLIEIKANWMINKNWRDTSIKLDAGKEFIKNSSSIYDFVLLTEDILYKDCKEAIGPINESYLREKLFSYLN